MPDSADSSMVEGVSRGEALFDTFLVGGTVGVWVRKRQSGVGYGT